MHYNFIVIGSGLAGLSFALKASKLGSVLILSKATYDAGSTSKAQGGIASVIHSNDSTQSHIDDTIIAGAGLCREQLVKILVNEGSQAIQDLVKWGVLFSKTKKSSFDLRKEGGHTNSRILHVKDYTGLEIQRALIKACITNPNIRIEQKHTVIDLVTSKHLKTKVSTTANKCYGVYTFDEKNNKVKIFSSGITILCTGGLGQIYQHSTNDAVSTGDGMAIALRAGAALENMEFIQFHPTSLYNPGKPIFLISEALRGYGGILKNKEGTPFMENIHPLKDLAPRDIVSREIDKQIKNSGHPCVYLDMTHFSQKELKENFPNIYNHCQQNNIEIDKDIIPVLPSAHFSCGGVKVDKWSATSIKNLYACGENASTGVHGANRLASNSLLEATVFSNRAIQKISTKKLPKKYPIKDIKPWDESKIKTNVEFGLYASALQNIQTTMWNYVGIVRTNNRLDRAQKLIQIIYQHIIEDYDSYKVTTQLIEIRNLALISLAIIKSALLRKESRGLNYNLDYPKTSNEIKHTEIVLSDIIPHKKASLHLI